MCKALRAEHRIDIVEEDSPVEDHQANGIVERAEGEFGGMTRVLNDQLIHNFQLSPPTNHPVYAWMVKCKFPYRTLSARRRW